jgi:leukotriene-A4 hydrolase
MIESTTMQTVHSIDWASMFYTEGMPPSMPNFDNPLADAAIAYAEAIAAYARSRGVGSFPLENNFHLWSTAQKTLFLDKLTQLSEDIEDTEEWYFSDSVLNVMDRSYPLTHSGNAEVKFRWQMLCLRREVMWIVPFVVDFITSQGRMKFVRPLYRALRGSDVGGDVAVETFNAKKGIVTLKIPRGLPTTRVSFICIIYMQLYRNISPHRPENDRNGPSEL